MTETERNEMGEQKLPEEEYDAEETERSGDGADDMGSLTADPVDSRKISEETQTATPGDGGDPGLRRDGGVTPSSERQRGREELFQLGELYPGVRISDLPREVRESELPLAAAYALYEKKQERIAEAAAEANRRNAERSAGGLSSFTETFYSPDEVRRMTRKEVRDNYESILRSMKRWK